MGENGDELLIGGSCRVIIASGILLTLNSCRFTLALKIRFVNKFAAKNIRCGIFEKFVNEKLVSKDLQGFIGRSTTDEFLIFKVLFCR